MTAALYVALGSAIAAALWWRPDDRALFAGVRAALWVGWVHAALDVEGPLRPALLHAAWFAAFAWTFRGRRLAWPVAIGWALLGALLEVGLTGAAPVWRGGAVVVAAGSGYWLCRAMLSGGGAVGRMLLHWASFAGTFAYLVPVLILRHAGPASSPSPSSTWRLVVAAALAALAVFLAAWGSRSFLRAGGTPEPLDAPVRLATDGAFARLRNPIQLAEMGLVTAAALWWFHPWTVAYALVFTAALLGPVRWHEERRLAERFGEAYARYRQRTPAYLPYALTPRRARPARRWLRLPGRSGRAPG